MMKPAWFALLVVGLSTVALAQDDDDLVPLGPIAPKAKPKPRPKPKPAVQKPKPQPKPDDDDLVPIAPMIAKGDVVIKLSPALSGAVLTVDGKEVGTLPLAPQSVASGEHTVSVKRAGYAAFVKKVMVTGGKTAEVDAKLTAVAAVLSVQSDVPGAQVLLNGKPIGVAPLNDVEVAPGPAEVAVIKEGFREDTQKITFVAGRDYPIIVRFNPAVVAASDRPEKTSLTPTGTAPTGPLAGVSAAPEPITSKWYFWTAVVVGVAGASVGIWAGANAVTEANKLTPAKICHPEMCAGTIGSF